MSTYKPKIGDYVRVAYEGKVFEVGESYFICTQANGSSRSIVPNWADSIEKIDPPEPEWKPGDVVMDAEGDLYIRVDDSAVPWIEVRGDGSVTTWSNSAPARPLRRLVPEAQ